MSDKRLGCYTCFHTLDPSDTQPGHQQFKRCTSCGAVYHAVCWRDESPCTRCSQLHSTTHSVSPPAPIPVVLRRRPRSIRPSAIYQVDKQGLITPVAQAQSFGNVLLTTSDWLSALLGGVAVFLIATVMGAYTLRILFLIQNGDFSASTILDEILTRSLPGQTYFTFSAVASLVLCLFFLRTKTSEATIPSKTETNVLMKLFSAALVLASIDIILFDLSLLQLTHLDNLQEIVFPTFVTQFGAMGLMVILVPIYRHNAPKLPRITDFITPTGRDGLVIIWYIVVTLGILSFVIKVSDTLANHIIQTELIIIRNGNWEISLFYLGWGAFAGALLISLFVYRLPQHLRSRGSNRAFRLVFFLLCSVAVVYTYTGSISPEAYILLLSLTGALTLLFVPLHQYLFSSWATYQSTSE